MIKIQEELHPEDWKQLVDDSIDFELEDALQHIMSSVGNDSNTLVIMNILKKFVYFPLNSTSILFVIL